MLFRNGICIFKNVGGRAVNWSRTILDGIVMCVIFNGLVGLFFFLFPQAYSRMFPNGIKQAGAPYVNMKDVKVLRCVLIAIYLLMFLYMAVSAHSAGVRGFQNLFWTGYVEMMFVNAGDFFLLDVLARKYVMEKGFIKGAEGHPDWKWNGWRKLAVPEHGLGWPLLFCPLTCVIVAGIGALLGW